MSIQFFTSLTDRTVVPYTDQKPAEGRLLWSGDYAVPALGDRVKGHCDAPGVVIGYFAEHGFLGIVVRPDTTRADTRKRLRTDLLLLGDCMFCFGVEFRPHAGGPKRLRKPAFPRGRFSVDQRLAHVAEGLRRIDIGRDASQADLALVAEVVRSARLNGLEFRELDEKPGRYFGTEYHDWFWKLRIARNHGEQLFAALSEQAA